MVSLDKKSRLRKAVQKLEQGDIETARRLAESMHKKSPKSAAPLNLLGDIAMLSRNFPRAVKMFARVVELLPNEAESQFRLGFAYMQMGRLNLAAKHLQQAVKLRPNFGEAYIRLCAVLGQLGQLTEAVVAGEVAVRLMPDSATAQTNLGSAYEVSGRERDALVCRRAAARLWPAHPVIQNSLGNALASVGDKQGAVRCYREAVRLQPKYTTPWRLLTRLCHYTKPDEPDAVMIRRLLSDPSIHEAQRSDLHFALGKIYDDCGRYDEAFTQFEAANKIENKKHAFDPNVYLRQVDAITSVFTKEMLESKADLGDGSDLPVFIVGMPRSGSTLVEQIIASHVDAHGGGELYWFSRIDQHVTQVTDGNMRYPECARLLDAEGINSLAANYMDNLRVLMGGVKYARVTDKFLGNYLHLGLIHLLFPRARIIHCQRNPLDTCLSIFGIVTPNSLQFAYNLENIAVAYNGYRRVMRHWQAVIPDSLLSINYEDLVRNQEPMTRKLLDFIGLPWDPACLHFHAADSPARTLSAAQVREPIHDRSIGRGESYKSYLGPLIRILESENNL